MEESKNAVHVDYPGCPHGLTFAVADRCIQLVHLRNGFARQSVMFKIQSTSSRKFRVRPGLGTLMPRETTAVQIQLSPQENEPSECRFLVVARRIDPLDTAVQAGDGVVSRRTSTATVADRAHQQQEAEEKAAWQRAEARHQDSLVLTETITVRIIPADTKGSNEQALDQEGNAQPPVAMSSPHLQPAQSVEQLSLDSIEARANIVVLLMKNQSKHPLNKLTVGQLEALANLRERDADAWQQLTGYASRMRALARQYRRLPSSN